MLIFQNGAFLLIDHQMPDKNGIFQRYTLVIPDFWLIVIIKGRTYCAYNNSKDSNVTVKNRDMPTPDWPTYAAEVRQNFCIKPFCNLYRFNICDWYLYSFLHKNTDLIFLKPPISRVTTYKPPINGFLLFFFKGHGRWGDGQDRGRLGKSRHFLMS